jgi:hypothetical protein
MPTYPRDSPVCIPSPAHADKGSSQRSNEKLDPTRRTRAYNLVEASFWGRGGTKHARATVARGKDIIGPGLNLEPGPKASFGPGL